jgi:hypothetical protein
VKVVYKVFLALGLFLIVALGGLYYYFGKCNAINTYGDIERTLQRKYYDIFGSYNLNGSLFPVYCNDDVFYRRIIVDIDKVISFEDNKESMLVWIEGAGYPLSLRVINKPTGEREVTFFIVDEDLTLIPVTYDLVEFDVVEDRIRSNYKYIEYLVSENAADDEFVTVYLYE